MYLSLLKWMNKTFGFGHSSSSSHSLSPFIKATLSFFVYPFPRSLSLSLPKIASFLSVFCWGSHFFSLLLGVSDWLSDRFVIDPKRSVSYSYPKSSTFLEDLSDYSFFS